MTAYDSGMSTIDGSDDRLYFRQLLSGYSFAADDQTARQMANFVYLIGDRSTGECAVIDPAYSVQDIVDVAAADGMRITHALATHYHPDHVGGSFMHMDIEGIAQLLEIQSVVVHANRHEVPWISRSTGVTDSDIVAHDGGDVLSIGGVDITMVHTPGHTPGSQCFHVNGCLLSGDTLFLDGCGRTDLPGSDPAQMFESLQTLDSMDSSTLVFPGHRYSPPAYESLEQLRQHNFVLKPKTKEQWLAVFAS